MQFREWGYSPTGDATNISEFWKNESGEEIIITRASELSPDDRAASVERMRRVLGFGFPEFPRAH
jgi:hypothetical protein